MEMVKIFQARKAADAAKLRVQAADAVVEIAQRLAFDAGTAAVHAEQEYLCVIFQQGFCPMCASERRPLTPIDSDLRCKEGHDNNIAMACSAMLHMEPCKVMVLK